MFETRELTTTDQVLGASFEQRCACSLHAESSEVGPDPAEPAERGVMATADAKGASETPGTQRTRKGSFCLAPQTAAISPVFAYSAIAHGDDLLCWRVICQTAHVSQVKLHLMAIHFTGRLRQSPQCACVPVTMRVRRGSHESFLIPVTIGPLFIVFLHTQGKLESFIYA